MPDTDELIAAFIERVDRLEARYRLDKYATDWLMPREMMIALRDALTDEQRKLF